MPQKIDTLTIERFRAFLHLEIQGMGRVNLITGRNNTGKSSVLEALRLLASGASAYVIYDILRSREEYVPSDEEGSRPQTAESMMLTSSFFHGFPPASEKAQPIVISSKGTRPLRLEMLLGWFSQAKNYEGEVKYHPSSLGTSPNGSPLTAGLGLTIEGRKELLPIDALHNDSSRKQYSVLQSLRLACVFVSPFEGERTTTLVHLWDSIALSDREPEVVKSLQIIDPEISRVSMVGGEGPGKTRKAIVRSRTFPRPVSLRSYGDGLNRLFGIILSAVNAKDGMLLIDEFENGMHHSVQTDTWRALFALAKRLDIQVFATSHSWDAVEAFQKAAAENPEEGVLIRLSRKGEDIIPTLFREDELAIATRDHIEVR